VICAWIPGPGRGCSAGLRARVPVAVHRYCCRWRWTFGQLVEERLDGWSRVFPDLAAGEPRLLWYEVGDGVGLDDPTLGKGLSANEGG